MAERTMARDLTQGNVLRLLLRFSAPIVAANILQIVYTLVDMLVIGRFVGTAGISAVSSAGDVMMLFTNFSMGVSSAGQIIIAQFQGKGDRESVKKAIGTMFCFVAILSLSLTAIALPLVEKLLGIIKTPEEAWSMAVGYARICISGLFFIFGYSSVGAILRGMGDSRHPLMFIAIATITNMILDVLFCGPLQMGAPGAALATVIGQGISFLFSLGYLYRHRTQFGFDFKRTSFRINGTILKMIVRLGIPMALQHLAVNISVMYVAACINVYGVVISAMAGIGNKLRMVVGIFTGSVGTAGAAMTAQNIGAGKYDRVRKIYWISLLTLLVSCGVIGGLGAIFPKTVIGFFDSNPAMLEMAPEFMLINLVVCLSFAVYQPFIILINGIGYASFAFITGIIDGLVARIGLVWLFNNGLGLGYWGIWWGAALAAYVVATIGFFYFISGHWKNRKLITDTGRKK
ncbi:MAG: MATE family efflux transporter [Oscillospiraceae bacterium]|nr:MATE family efflux transporter [Oscillospiraceae bacterium]